MHCGNKTEEARKLQSIIPGVPQNLQTKPAKTCGIRISTFYNQGNEHQAMLRMLYVSLPF